MQSLDLKSIETYPSLTEDIAENNLNSLNWSYLFTYTRLSEHFLTRHLDKIIWSIIVERQQLSESFIEKHIEALDLKRVLLYQNLSKEFKRRHNIQFQPLKKAVFYCGKYNRPIQVYRKYPKLITIGCFTSTRKEAIERISKKYTGKERDIYISKINECFNYKS